MTATHFLHAISRQYSFLATCGSSPAESVYPISSQLHFEVPDPWFFFIVAELSGGHYCIHQVNPAVFEIFLSRICDLKVHIFTGASLRHIPLS